MKQIIKTITPEEAKELIENRKGNEDFVLLDIRTEPEINQERINGCERLDFYIPDFKEKLDELDKNKAYLIYCRTASRTKAAMRMMQELGFKEVYELDGGIMLWKMSGFAIVSG